jgi:organic hydroperoxide reductase OsmC/OhrA
MEKLHEYSTSVTWTERRRGKLEAPGLPTVTTGAPPDFGGEEGVWSPEHFFVASAEVCVMLTFLAIAEMSKLEVAGWSSSAQGKVEKVEGQGFLFTRLEIDAEVQVKRESDVHKAERILQKAENNCLVTKSMKTPVEFRFKIHVVGE